MKRLTFCLIALGLTGCIEDDPVFVPTDSGSADSGSLDSGSPDLDGGGPRPDTGTPEDGGAPDSATPDGGAEDAGGPEPQCGDLVDVGGVADIVALVPTSFGNRGIAADWPPLRSCAITRRKGKRATSATAFAAVPSVEPSST